MKRQRAKSWPNWQKELEEIGFVFHTPEGAYWNSEFCYTFTSEQIDFIESATNALQEICIGAVEKIMKDDWYERLHITPEQVVLIEEAWENDHLSIYGRFDLAWDGSSDAKLLEYNADTPTSLLEASVAQWKWLKALYPAEDQFNSIHEKLIARWPQVARQQESLYFTCMRESEEDICQTEYLRDTAVQAGLNTYFIPLDQVGWDSAAKQFVDEAERPMQQAFKLYPWEWMTKEAFGKNIPGKIRFIEPAWKMLLSNKALLPILWELNPDHPYLLPTQFAKPTTGEFVRKPIFSREGANIARVSEGRLQTETDGPYGEEGYIYQAFQSLPAFDGHYPVIGSWIVGEVACGMGIREDVSPITQNSSQFVPHYFTS